MADKTIMPKQKRSNLKSFATPKKTKKSPTRRGRPSVLQQTEITRIILAAATDCFLKNGYDGTSMDAIAAASRITKVTIYTRYPDKETLLLAAIEERVRAWSAASTKLNLKSGETLPERLRHYATSAMTRATSEEVRAVDRLIASAPPEAARMLHDIRYNSMVSFLEHEIETMTSSEGKPAKSAKRVAGDLMALLAGWLHMEAFGRTVSKREAVAFARHAVDVIMASRETW